MEQFYASEQVVYIINISFDLWANDLIVTLIRLNGASIWLYQDAMENSQTFLEIICVAIKLAWRPICEQIASLLFWWM